MAKERQLHITGVVSTICAVNMYLAHVCITEGPTLNGPQPKIWIDQMDQINGHSSVVFNLTMY